MASLQCGPKCAKYILFLFNFIFMLCGGALLAVGIWMRVDPNFSSYIQIISASSNNPLINTANIVIIAVGAVIFLVAALGCAGACCENACFLLMYAILLVIIIIGQVAGGVLAVLFNQQLGSVLKSSMVKQANENYNGAVHPGSQELLTKAWDVMQVKLKCCGGNNFLDYRNSKFVRDTTAKYSVPLSCCILSNTDSSSPKPQDQTKCMEEGRVNGAGDVAKFLYKDGCYNKLKSWLTGRAGLIAGVALGIVVIQILGIVFACCLRRAILRSDGEKHI